MQRALVVDTTIDVPTVNTVWTVGQEVIGVTMFGDVHRLAVLPEYMKDDYQGPVVTEVHQVGEFYVGLSSGLLSPSGHTLALLARIPEPPLRSVVRRRRKREPAQAHATVEPSGMPTDGVTGGKMKKRGKKSSIIREFPVPSVRETGEGQGDSV